MSNLEEKGNRVAVVGGGIAGLSTAYYLEKEAAEAGIPLDVVVLESAPGWGGKIRTEHMPLPDGEALVEAGPDSFIVTKPWAMQLARELGLETEVIGTNDAERKVYVMQKGRPVPLPDGLMLMVPTRFMPFALSPLISWPGKIRMAMDAFIPVREGDEDESVGDFVRRRLGQEALDKIAEPLLSGIYNADVDEQSLLATFPRFRNLEKKHGSMTRGMLAAKKNRPKPKPGAKKKSMFVTFRQGTQTLTDALVEAVDADLRAGTTVQDLVILPDGRYKLYLDDKTTLDADAVVLATPSYVSADLVGALSPAAAEKLSRIRYVDTGTISLAYRAADVKQPLDGHGLVVPRSENRPINAITVSSSKFDDRAPEDVILLRVFFGGSRSPQSMLLKDDELLATVQAELNGLMGIEVAPLNYSISRWIQSNPQYDVGHLELVDEIEAGLPAGLHVTGSPYRGVGLPDCVKQSQQTAAKIVGELASTPVPAD